MHADKKDPDFDVKSIEADLKTFLADKFSNRSLPLCGAHNNNNEKRARGTAMSCNSSILVATTQSVHVGGVAYNLSIFSVTFFIVFMLVSCLAFLCHQPHYVMLRKRPFRHILLSCFAVLALLSFSSIYDLVGESRFPCVLLLILFHFGITLVSMHIIFKINTYACNKKSIHLDRVMRYQRGSSISLPSNASTRSLQLQPQQQHSPVGMLPKDIPPLASWTTFTTFLKLSFPTNSREATLEDKRLSLQFMKSWGYILFWYPVTCLLGLIAFIIRLSTDSTITQCPAMGCQLTSLDIAFQIANITICIGIVSVTFPLRRVKKGDSLKIAQTVGILARLNIIQVIAFVLYLVDPGDVMLHGEFNWLNLVLVYAFLLIYIQTWHQIWLAKRTKNEALKTMCDLEACYEETMSDPVLRRDLQKHLDSELSSEVYLFMDAVHAFKQRYALPVMAPSRLGKAREIFDMFVKRGAAYEINVSSRCRDNTTEKLTGAEDKSNHTILDVFDSAMEEVRSNFLRDGFQRFLTKMEERKKKRNQHAPPSMPLNNV